MLRKIIRQQERKNNLELIRKVFTIVVAVVAFFLFICNGIGLFSAIIPMCFIVGMTYLYTGMFLGLVKVPSSSGGLMDKIGQGLLNLNESYVQESHDYGPKFMSGLGMQDEQYVRSEIGRYRYVEDRYGNEKRLTKKDGAWYDDDDNCYEDL